MLENSRDPDQTPHSVASDQVLHCLPMSHKRKLGLYGLTNISHARNFVLMFNYITLS